MPLQLSDDLKALVRGANFAQLATLMRDGSPQVAPVWVDLDGDFILVSTGEGSLKAKNTRRDARVGLSIIAMDNPYREAQIRGRVVERRPDADFKTMDRISHKYTGRPFRSATIPRSASCSRSRSIATRESRATRAGGTSRWRRFRRSRPSKRRAGPTSRPAPSLIANDFMSRMGGRHDDPHAHRE